MQRNPNETGTGSLAQFHSRRFSDNPRGPLPVSFGPENKAPANGLKNKGKVLLLPLAAILTAVAMLAIILSAPTERTMGDAKRIVYVHVAVAGVGWPGS